MQSGQRLDEGFREGWAVKPFGVAHYFVAAAVPSLRVALCGSAIALPSQLFEQGVWTRCKRCSARLPKHQSQSLHPGLSE